MAEISIIVPVYNVEKYLNRCIDSILNQTFKDFELILVDDESPDRCGAICEAYSQKDARIKVIHKKNGGVSDARNAGLDVAKGKYIGFVDSDDYIDNDMYEYLYGNAIKENADVSMCEFYHCYSGRKIEKHPCTYYHVTNSIGAIYCVLESKITSVTVVNKLYKRELFENIRFKYGITAEDAEIMIRVLEKANKIVISNEQKYYYFHRTDSTTTKPLNEKDYDVVDVYDHIKNYVTKLSPCLEQVALMRQCWARFYMLDKMMLYDGNYDKSRQKQYISFLKKNKIFIIKNNIFSIKRRISFIFLLTNIKFYRILVKSITKRRKNVND